MKKLTIKNLTKLMNKESWYKNWTILKLNKDEQRQKYKEYGFWYNYHEHKKENNYKYELNDTDCNIQHYFPNLNEIYGFIFGRDFKGE